MSCMCTCSIAVGFNLAHDCMGWVEASHILKLEKTVLESWRCLWTDLSKPILS